MTKGTINDMLGMIMQPRLLNQLNTQQTQRQHPHQKQLSGQVYHSVYSTPLLCMRKYLRVFYSSTLARASSPEPLA